MINSKKSIALALGVFAALAWISAASVSFDRGLQPVRPLYDGGAPPPPYRFVTPPDAFKADNQKPTTTTKTFPVKAGRSPSQAIASDDSQASIVFSDGGFVVPKGATGVEVTITPLDPATKPAAPKGLALEGNAYRFDAVYLPSRDPLTLTSPCPEVTSCATIILRWPLTGTHLLKEDAGAWKTVTGVQHLPSPSFQIYGNVESLGTYIAAGVPTEMPSNDSLANVLALALGVVAVIAAVVVSRVLPARRKARAKQAMAKRKPQGKAAKRKKGR